MKILSVVGARPQFVKLAPVAEAAAEVDVDHVIVHTGQHYDTNMSQSFFDHLNIPEPHVNLEIGSGTHGVQTGAMMTALDPVLMEQRPDWVLVYGDTNSTLAAALCSTKLHIPLAHLEAGLRSFNRAMPEEHNRVLTDHSSDLCLAPTKNAMAHLASEGLAPRSHLVGDVMTDVALRVAKSVTSDPVPSPVPMADDVVIATIHRPTNTDDPIHLARILDSLSRIEGRVFLPLHPRLGARCREAGLDPAARGINVVEPLTYPQLIQALQHARAVVTDSGGLQKEAFLMGVPTATLRTETEWTETLGGGWNVLVSDPRTLGEALGRPHPSAPRGAPYGDGRAAGQAIRLLVEDSDA